ASTCASARLPIERASFLPGPQSSVRDKLDLLSMHRIDLTQGAVLEKDCVYIVPLLEHVALRKRTSAAANPKSSTGRLDVFARVITDHATEFDRARTAIKDRSLPRCRRAPSVSWCGPVPASCSCASAAARPGSAMPRCADCTKKSGSSTVRRDRRRSAM